MGIAGDHARGAEPPTTGADWPLVVAAMVIDVGALFFVVAGGLLMPIPVVIVGLTLWAVMTGAMVWMLRAGDGRALLAPVVLVAAWQQLMLLGPLVFGWQA